jgi:DNA polymerase III sliding clamp (beta) subunit (PCNA family)
LLRPLQAVTGIVEKRHTLPILSNVLLERREDELQLVATDLEIQVLTISEAGRSTGVVLQKRSAWQDQPGAEIENAPGRCWRG